MLRLHVVEVNSEQEPPILEEEDEKFIENNEVVKEHESGGESVNEASDTEVDKSEKDITKDKEGEETELKEVEMDDWLFEFAQLFRTHVDIDPDAHVDLHELGMELCSEAIEETITSRKPLSAIISGLEEIAKRMKLKVKKKDIGVVTIEPTEEGRKGVMAIDAEIFEVTATFHLVEVKKMSGDSLEYRKIMKEDIRPGLKDIVWTWQCEKQPIEQQDMQPELD